MTFDCRVLTLRRGEPGAAVSKGWEEGVFLMGMKLPFGKMKKFWK